MQTEQEGELNNCTVIYTFVLRIVFVVETRLTDFGQGIKLRILCHGMFRIFGIEISVATIER